MKTKEEKEAVDKSKTKDTTAKIVLIGFLTTLVILLFAVASVSAAEYQVHEGESIQAAINMANPGDNITVHNGTYTENVVVNRSKITIRSANGSAVTIVQSNSTDTHVFNITDQNNVTVEGFSICDASAAPSMTKGLIAMSLSALVLPPEYQTGSIRVTSEPSGARVYLEGFVGPAFTTPHTFGNVQVGYHKITVTHEGYYDWSDTVQVHVDETAHVNARLKPKHKPTPTPKATGAIAVASRPSGASICLDGQCWGMLFKTPDTIHDVKPGRHHKVELYLEGYKKWSKVVPVTAGRTTPVHATLTPKPTPTPPPPATGAIRIESTPTHATIELDGHRLVGPISATPATIPDLDPGYHTIKLSHDGYHDWGPKEVHVTAGKTTPVHATLVPIQKTGSISVHSSPSGATIYLEGFVGPTETTPHTFTKVSPGHRKLNLSLVGYYPWSTDAKVTAGHTTPIHATLTPIPTTGTITVFSSPPGAEIYLDNNYEGRTLHTITDVLPGYHTIRLCLEGYRDWSTPVLVTAGDTTPVQATLTAIPTTGAISVNSEPPGANIGLDGVPINALTPYTITNVVSGTHILELTLKGYLDWSAKVHVVPGKTADVDAPLIPRPIRAGIYMNNASNCVIISNRIMNITTTVNYSAVGIAIYNSSGNEIQNGEVINCGQGIWIASGSENGIEGNIIQDNTMGDTGVRLESGVINTEIHENCFIDNDPQAWDDGTDNNWVSNFWSPPPGGTGNYTIPGAAGCEDTDHLSVCPLTQE
ncbi:MAG TPA: PEGA domain-containing protein [Methanophagales archaeon]|nr:PEGA domain-containing protein [Methanophagales archaeon]